jgi:predicted nucleic acid-binding protein
MTASRALTRMRQVTSEMVLVEVLNGLAEQPALRVKVVAAVDAIMADPNTEVVPQSTLLFREALAHFRQHQDKEWGLTDCSSFVIMRQRSLQ